MSRESFACRAATTALVASEAMACGGPRSAGELSPTASLRSSSPPRVPDAPIAPSLAISTTHACVERGGSVWCWGANDDGAVGAPQRGVSRPVRVEGLERVTKVVVGTTFSCALEASGHVLCWGKDLLHAETTHVPTRIADIEGARDLAAGPEHVCIHSRTEDASARGRVTCIGRGRAGVLGDGEAEMVMKRVELSDIGKVRSLAASEHTTCAVLEPGSIGPEETSNLVCWGWTPGSPPSAPPTKPRRVPVKAIVEAVYLQDNLTLCTTRVGAIGAIGDDLTCQRDEEQLHFSAVKAVAVGQDHGCFVDSDGLTCWGGAGSGARGPLSPSMRWDKDPMKVPGLDDAPLVAAAWKNTCAMRRSGEVVCFGNALNGLLGTGQSTEVPVPTTPAALGPVDDLVLGEGWGCALQTGRLYCFGQVDWRVLSKGTRERFLPTEQPLAEPAEAIFTLGETVCARGKSGASTCIFGGLSMSGEPQSPTDEPELRDARKLTGEHDRVLMLGKDGKLRGRSRGDETSTRIDGVADVADVAMLQGLACAVLSSGKVLCFDDPLVTGESHVNVEPHTLGGLSDATKVWMAAHQPCVLRKAGGLSCFSGARASALVPSKQIADAIDAIDAAVTEFGDTCVVTSDHHVDCVAPGGGRPTNDTVGAWPASPVNTGWRRWPDVSEVTKVVVGIHGICAIGVDRVVRCVGSNDGDALGMRDVLPWSYAPMTVRLE